MTRWQSNFSKEDRLPLSTATLPPIWPEQPFIGSPRKPRPIWRTKERLETVNNFRKKFLENSVRNKNWLCGYLKGLLINIYYYFQKNWSKTKAFSAFQINNFEQLLIDLFYLLWRSLPEIRTAPFFLAFESVQNTFCLYRYLLFRHFNSFFLYLHC